ncbi:YqcC family protein [Thiolapillus sp.]
MMSDDYQELSQYLQRLETELRRLGWWSDLPPDDKAFESTAPFCHDCMTLDQWLQWVFIPNFQALIRSEQPLPEKCAIAPMGEISWSEEPPETVAELIRLMQDIDALVSR